MNQLPLLDIAIIGLYLLAMMGVGVYFARKGKTADSFTKASGQIPGWAIGLSLFGTFLSSNTFLGVPGKAFGSNWNSYVFSLSLPLAAWIAARYFVPFYRRIGGVSAYEHLEHRFGAWARTYAVVCFLLTQMARTGSIFFGIALSLQALTGYDMAMIMLVTGVCVTFYTVLGGIEAVIWTDVMQSILLIFGALLVLVLVLMGIPGGVSTVIEAGMQDDKFSLGSFAPDFTSATFWTILLYGLFINLNNFGIDQNYVQRYHTARNEEEAHRSLWLSVKVYVPVSLVFFVIGTCLYVYAQVHPDWLEVIRMRVASERLPGVQDAARLSQEAASLTAADLGDKVMPHFIVTNIPVGLTGLLIAAILSAAMSTISSNLNSAATIFLVDLYQRYFNRTATPERSLKVLYLATAGAGLLGTIVGISMIGVKSILDVWWELSGIFAGGMLGLFVLGMASRRANNQAAFIAVIVGILIIIWLTFSKLLPPSLEFLRNPLHVNMTIVVGTLSIFLVGLLVSRLRQTT